MKHWGRTPDESRNVRDTTMPFTLHVEHEVIGGKTVLETFEGVESFNDPPMVDTLNLSFVDDRETKNLDYGNVVRAVDETTNGTPDN